MRINLLMKGLVWTFILAAIPVLAPAQSIRTYNHTSKRLALRDVITRLDNSSARLESDLIVRRQHSRSRIADIDTKAMADVHNFRLAVRDLSLSSRGVVERSSADEARSVLKKGARLDRYLRLRTGSPIVDSDLADIRSGLHLIADAYGLRVPRA